MPEGAHGVQQLVQDLDGRVEFKLLQSQMLRHAEPASQTWATCQLLQDASTTRRLCMPRSGQCGSLKMDQRTLPYSDLR